jgi:hypothetical protein
LLPSGCAKDCFSSFVASQKLSSCSKRCAATSGGSFGAGLIRSSGGRSVCLFLLGNRTSASVHPQGEVGAAVPCGRDIRRPSLAAPTLLLSQIAQVADVGLVPL